MATRFFTDKLANCTPYSGSKCTAVATQGGPETTSSDCSTLLAWCTSQTENTSSTCETRFSLVKTATYNPSSGFTLSLKSLGVTSFTFGPAGIVLNFNISTANSNVSLVGACASRKSASNVLQDYIGGWTGSVSCGTTGFIQVTIPCTDVTTVLATDGIEINTQWSNAQAHSNSGDVGIYVTSITAGVASYVDLDLAFVTTHEAAADLTALAAIDDATATIYEDYAAANLEATTTFDADGNIIYAQTGALELTGFRFQEYSDVEGGTPNWVTALNRGLAVDNDTFTWIKKEQTSSDVSYLQEEFAAVKLRVLLKNTSADSIPGYSPFLSSKIDKYSETRFINNRGRMWLPRAVPFFDPNTTSNNVDTYLTSSKNLKAVYPALMLARRPTSKQFVLLTRDVDESNSSAPFQIKTYNSSTGVWDTTNYSTFLNTVTPNQHLSIQRVPVYGRIVSDKEYVQVNTSIYYLPNTGNLVLESSAVSYASPSFRVPQVFYIRNQYGFFVFSTWQGRFYEADNSYAYNGRSLSLNNSQYGKFATLGVLTLRNHELFLIADDYGKNIKWYDFTSDTSGTMGSVTGYRLYKVYKNKADTTGYFLFLDDVGTVHHTISDIEVYEFDVATRTFSNYTMTESIAADFLDGLIDQDDNTITGFIGDNECSYTRKNFPRVDGSGYHNDAIHWALTGTDDTSDAVADWCFNTTLPNTGLLTSTSWTVSGYVVNKSSADRRYYNTYAVQEFVYPDKDGKFASYVHASGETIAATAWEMLWHEHLASGTDYEDRTATQQELGSGTFVSANTGILGYGIANDSIGVIPAGSEIEIVISLLINKTEFLADPDDPIKILYLLSDSKNTLVEPSASLIPYIERGASPKANLVVNTTLTADLPIEATLESVSSLAALATMTLGGKGALHIFTDIWADALPAVAFQTVLTQFQQEGGSETSPMLVGAPNLPWKIDVNTPAAQDLFWMTASDVLLFKIRFLIRNTSGVSKSFDPQLQIRKDGGAWSKLSTTAFKTHDVYYSHWQGRPIGTFTGDFSSSNVAIVETAYENLKLMNVLPGSGSNKYILWHGEAYNTNDSDIVFDTLVHEWDSTDGSLTSIGRDLFKRITLVNDTNNTVYEEQIDSIAMSNGDIYIMIADSQTSECIMMKYTYSTTTWAEISGHGLQNQGSATTQQYYFRMFESGGSLYSFGWDSISSNSYSISVYKFNGSTWSSEANDGYKPGGNVQYPLAIIFDTAAGKIQYLMANINPSTSAIMKADYTISSKTFSTPVQAFPLGTVTASHADQPVIQTQATPENSNLFITMMSWQSVFSRLMEWDKSSGLWATHSSELIYNTNYSPRSYWDDELGTLIFENNAFRYNPDADTYHSYFKLSMPTNIYSESTDFYYGNLFAVITQPGATQPIYYFTYGSSDPYFTIGYYVKGASQDLQYEDQHWKDTTKQLPSDGSYTFKTPNAANVMQQPGLESALTLADGEEVEIAYSLWLDKTALDTAAIDTSIQFQLLNQGVDALDNREHFPTINYTVYDRHSGGLVSMNTLAALTASAEVAAITDKFGYADLEVTASMAADLTQTAVDVLGEALMQVIAYTNADAYWIIGTAFGRRVDTIMTADAFCNHFTPANLIVNTNLIAVPNRTVGAASNLLANVTMTTAGSFSRFGVSIQTVTTAFSVSGHVQSFNTVNLPVNAFMASTAEVSKLVSVNMLIGSEFYSYATMELVGDLALPVLTDMRILPNTIRPGVADLLTSVSFTGLPVLEFGVTSVLGVLTDITADPSMTLEALVSMRVSTGMGGVLEFDDNRDIAFFNSYIDQVVSISLFSATHTYSQSIHRLYEYSTNTQMSYGLDRIIASVVNFTMDIKQSFVFNLQLTEQNDVIPFNAYFSRNNSFSVNTDHRVLFNVECSKVVAFTSAVTLDENKIINLG